MSELPSAESCLSVDSAWPRGSADISSISRRNYDILLTLVWLIRLFTHWNLFPPVSGSIVRETTSVVDWALNVSVRRVGLLHTPILHAIVVPLCSLQARFAHRLECTSDEKLPLYICIIVCSHCLWRWPPAFSWSPRHVLLNSRKPSRSTTFCSRRHYAALTLLI